MIVTLAGSPPLPNRTHGRHWSAARTKQGREHTYLALITCARDTLDFSATRHPRPRLRVTLTRIGPRKADHSNIVASFKAVQDGVADYLWRDCDDHAKTCGHLHDGDPRVKWLYDQDDGPVGVRIEVERRRQVRRAKETTPT